MYHRWVPPLLLETLDLGFKVEELLYRGLLSDGQGWILQRGCAAGTPGGRRRALARCGCVTSHRAFVPAPQRRG